MKRQNKLNLLEFNKMKESREKITWITAYDLPFAYVAEQAGVDMILVGDSGGMVQLGYHATNPVTMEEMLMLAKAARRGAPNTFIVGDMPQGSYEISDESAVMNALRFVKEAGCDAIKLEGGQRITSRVKAIADAGILVFGHLGLTPQSATSFGGYRVQGKTLKSFEETIMDALALQRAGAFGILLEAMPTEPAHQVCKNLKIPIMGIGAGSKVDGQLVIMHDVLGFYQAFRPWFAKCFIPQVVGRFQKYILEFDDIRKMGREERKDGLLMLAQLAVEQYVQEVKDGQFPSSDYCYEIQSGDLEELFRSTHWVKSLDNMEILEEAF